MITVTETAREKAVEFLEAEEKQDWALRLIVLQRGPRRFQYELNLEDPADKKEDDVVQDCDDFELWMDPQSAENAEGATMDFVNRGLESGFKFDNPKTRWDDPLAQAVQDVLDRDINPAVASHGGHIELVDVQDNAAIISFGGGCHGCGMVDVTLKQGVETSILNAVPEITRVLDSTDHSTGANPYFAREGDSPF